MSPSRRERPAHSLAVLLLCALAVSTYHLLFQTTKPSPVQHVGLFDRAVIVAWTLLLALIVAGACWPFAVALDWWSARRSPGATWGTTLFAVVVAAVGVLAFAENFAYSVAGIGLRAETGFILFKIVLGILVLSLGALLGRWASRLRPRTGRVFLTVALSLCVPATGLAAWSVHESVTPAPLKAHGAPHLVNVLILSSDGVDATHMSAYGYGRETTPFLDSVADEFAVYENAFADNGNTTGSIVSLLNGRSPADTGLVYPPDTLSAADARLTLPFLLGRLGYARTNFGVAHYSEARSQNLLDAFDVDNTYRQSRSPVTHLPLGAGPARWFVTETVESSVHLVGDLLGMDEVDNPYAALEPDGVTSDERRLKGIKAMISGGGRFFSHTHFMITHGPHYMPVERRWSVADESQESDEDEQDLWQKDAYDDTIHQFDSYVREVHQALEKAGLIDSTILVITSDHGEEWDARERVPLMIRFPDREHAGRYATNVQRLDVAPTVLDYLGFVPPTWMTGSSLLEPQVIPEDRQFLAANTFAKSFVRNEGNRPADRNLLLTAVRCRWWVQVTPTGETTTGTVHGSTSTCTSHPQPPEPGSVP